MNYYPFHIGDFRSGTVHMSRLARWIYRDMMDVYYDSEKPLTLDFEALCDQIGVESAEERAVVQKLLRFKFVQTEDGYRHDICDAVIVEYRHKAETARENGKAGGRPRKQSASDPKPNENPVGSQPDADGGLADRGLKTNQEPITNNHIKTSSSEQSPDKQVAAEPAGRKAEKKPKHAPEDEACAQWLFDRIRKSNPDHKPPNIGSWAGDVRLMRERDDRTHREICELFGWAQDDEFWRSNILSPAKLREKWDQLKMRRGTPQKGQKHDNFATQDYRAGIGADGSF